jgi:putative phosphoesterase
MRIAILSDIHANLDALQVVWADGEEQCPDTVYCLGDLVGYGASPNEVVAFLRERGVPTVMGNYDEGVGFDKDECGCIYRDPEEDRLGKLSLLWTRQQTTPENKAHLQKLEIQIRLDDQRPSLLTVHGSPRKISEYMFEDRPAATFERIARLAGSDILLFGHTHLPYQKRVSCTRFVNTGSVGKPKDGDARAGHVLLEHSWRTTVHFLRVAYDVNAAAKAIRQSGLPSIYADHLLSGGIPGSVS